MLKHLATSITLLLALTTQVQADEKAYFLIDIYQQALSHDPTLASALSANQAAQEIIEQGKALYRPSVNFNADANKLSTDIRYIGRDLPPSSSNFETYKYGVDLRQPIYR
jgi:outer membrane protein